MDIKASEGDKRACVINADHIPTGHVRDSLCIDRILPDVFIYLHCARSVADGILARHMIFMIHVESCETSF